MYVALHTEKFITTVRRTSQPLLINFQSDVIEMDFAPHQGVKEDVETRRGRRFIRRTFDRQLGKKKLSVMTNK